ncbi:universal stress protein [Fructilactobacillus myrtifloralis]|uniref:Universal stress protein n=1 Tax=Fructilactobacillus myrtifloralis TaxID=2940301 RepID=A0ABY5BNA4_9LACO|nr:universal stress protein [Fructilactobacillus myrtifloralis]USS85152.1 universal stress protein [Fructilactobacillus myrtifloralis]
MLQEYNEILVPVDGSYGAELAFEKAVAIAKRNHAHLHLVHAIDTRAYQDISSFDTSIVDEITTKSKTRLEKALQTAHDAGLTDVDYSIEYGAPKTIIAKELPQTLKVDLIIMGATGLNAVARLLIGSVTEYVTRNAPCDVLVVKTNLQNQLISEHDLGKQSH